MYESTFVIGSVTLIVMAGWTVVACRFLRQRVRSALGGGLVGLVQGSLYFVCLESATLLGLRQSLRPRLLDMAVVGAVSWLTIMSLSALGERKGWWPSKMVLLERLRTANARPSAS